MAGTVVPNCGSFLTRRARSGCVTPGRTNGTVSDCLKSVHYWQRDDTGANGCRLLRRGHRLRILPLSPVQTDAAENEPVRFDGIVPEAPQAVGEVLDGDE